MRLYAIEKLTKTGRPYKRRQFESRSRHGRRRLLFWTARPSQYDMPPHCRIVLFDLTEVEE